MDATTLIAMAVILAAGIVSGLSGFGFALVSVTPMLLLYDPPVVVLAAKVLPLLTGWLIVVERRRDIRWPTVLGLLPVSLAGSVVGVQVLERAPKPAISLASGVLVLGFALLVLRGWTPRGVNGPVATGVAGLASGVLNTANGLNGPPVVLLLTGRGLPPHPFRATLQAYFMIVGLAGLAMLVAAGAVGPSDWRTVAWLAPAALLGAVIGRSLVRFVSPERFRRITLVLLLVTGAIAVADGLRGLI